MARHQHRPRSDLHHSALAVQLDGDRFVIEMAPVWRDRVRNRGVVCEGPVGLPCLGRSRFFRYEVRRWHHGVIPDLSDAVASPLWNSNSLVSWLLARSGHDADGVVLPFHGRAPGWSAGLVVARAESAGELPLAETRGGAPI